MSWHLLSGNSKFKVENLQPLSSAVVKIKADFLLSQKPVTASQQVLAGSQNNYQSSHGYDNLLNLCPGLMPSLSFKQRQVNKAITIFSSGPIQ